MTKRSADRAEDALLDAAARLFRRKGFEASTVREIARAAGMLPGSVHYRFATKTALLLALVKRGVARDLAAVREAIAGSEDPLERLRLALRARLRLLLSGEDAVFVVLYDWRSLKGREREAMVRLRDGYEAFWKDLLEAAARTGKLRPEVDMKMLRFFVFGAVNWVAQWYSPRGPRTPDEIADSFFTLVARGVLADAQRAGGAEAPRRGPSVVLRFPAEAADVT